MGSLLLGLFGGIGGTLLWETLFQPWWKARGLARMLATEISLNMKLVAAQTSAASDRAGVPADFRLITIVFDAAVSDIGTLPPSAFRGVVLLYARYAGINRTVELFSDSFSRLQDAPAGSDKHKSLERAVAAGHEAFYRQLQSSLPLMNDTIGLLHPLGERLRWPRQKRVDLDQESVDAEMAALMKERERGIAARNIPVP